MPQEQRQCFECIWEVVHENEKQNWAYHGALVNTTVHLNGSREFFTDVYSRDPSRKLCFDPPHDDITKTEGFGKIKVDNINCVSLVHHVRHRFLEDQQIGETGPTG